MTSDILFLTPIPRLTLPDPLRPPVTLGPLTAIRGPPLKVFQGKGQMTEEDFTHCIEANRRDFVRIARRLVGPNDAEDVVQDASLKVFRKLDRLVSIRQAIIVAIYWLSINVVRDRKFEQDIFADGQEDWDSGVFVTKDESGDRQRLNLPAWMADQETVAILGEALSMLSEGEQESLRVVTEYEGEAWTGTKNERQVHRDRVKAAGQRLQRAA